MGNKSYWDVSEWFEPPSTMKKQAAEKARAEAEAKAASELASKQAELDKAKEAEAQQEAVRKKMASLGRLQAGYTFSDSRASTGATKVFS